MKISDSNGNDFKSTNATDAELAKRFGIPKVPQCEYVREKATGQIHAWDERFGKRGDLVEPYEPSLADRIKFGETVDDLHFVKGFSGEDLIRACVPVATLDQYGISHDGAKSTPPVPPVPPVPTKS